MEAAHTYFDHCPKDIRNELAKYIDVRMYSVLPWEQTPKNDRLAYYAADEGYLPLLKWALEHKYPLGYIPGKALRHDEITKFLFERDLRTKLYDLGRYGTMYVINLYTRYDSNFILGLVRRGDTKLLDHFLRKYNHLTTKGEVLSEAINAGSVEMFQYLIKFSDCRVCVGTSNPEMARHLISNGRGYMLSYSDCVYEGNPLVTELMFNAGLSTKVDRLWKYSPEMDKWMLIHHGSEVIALLLSNNLFERTPIEGITMEIAVKSKNIRAVEYLSERGVPIPPLMPHFENLYKKRDVKILRDLIGYDSIPIKMACRYPELFPERVQEILDHCLVNYWIERPRLEKLIHMGGVVKKGLEEMYPS